MVDLNLIYKDLDSDQRETIEALPISERLIEMAKMKDCELRELLAEVAEAAGLEVLEDINLVKNPIQRLPLRLINEYQCLPVSKSSPEDLEDDKNERAGDEDDPLSLVTLWLPNERMERWVFAVSGRKPKWYLSDPEQVINTITQYFGVGASSLHESDIAVNEAEDAEQEDEDAAVIRFVNEVVQKAVSDRATDIHFEPHRDSLHVRYRIDGELVPVRVPDNLIRFQNAIISRLKIMAKLNISEKRRPQDGRITFGRGRAELDIRISTFPTMLGTLIGVSLSLYLIN